MQAPSPDPTRAILRELIREVIREELAAVRAESEADHATTTAHGAPSVPAKEWITDVELAAWISVSRETCQQWRARGEGPPYRKVGRAVRYSVVETRAWIDAGKRGR